MDRLRLFNRHIEIDGIPVAKVLDMVHDYQIERTILEFDDIIQIADNEEKIAAKAYDEGTNEGYESGKADGIEQATKQILNILRDHVSKGKFSDIEQDIEDLVDIG